jgi:DNA-binding MarR family transcriptional regulator
MVAYAGRVSATRWLDDDEQTTWRTMLRHSVLMLDRLDAELRAAHGIGLADYEILVQLSEAPAHSLRMSELADRTLVSRSRLTHRVDRMTDAGLVSRAPCPTDRRGLFAVLSDDGLRLLEEAAPTHVAGVRRYVIDPLAPSTQRALTAELADPLAELEAAGVVTGCDEQD